MMISKNPNVTNSEEDSLPNLHRQKRSATTMRSVTSSTNPNESLPTLPFDLITEILSRLPVKFLLQFQCVCKSWDSLISNDHKFAKKQLTNSTTQSIYSIHFNYPMFLTIYPPNFFFDSAVSTKCLTYHSHNCKWTQDIVASCNGILCLAYEEFILLWNPSIGKIKELPLLPNPGYLNIMSYGFGYDSVTDHYKVVVVLRNSVRDCNGNFVVKNQVKVNTLGNTFWENIQEFPFFGTVPFRKISGKYVSGTINWLASSQRCIVSLDLANESYHKLLLPDYGEFNATSVLALTLDMFRDCLCIISGHGHDVWIMKEYGKKESWTKLFTISYKHDSTLSFFLEKVIYVFEDGQVLLQMKMPFVRPQLIVYDPRIGTFKFVIFPKSFHDSRSGVLDVSNYGGLVVCIESLISPCS